MRMIIRIGFYNRNDFSDLAESEGEITLGVDALRATPGLESDTLSDLCKMAPGLAKEVAAYAAVDIAKLIHKPRDEGEES